MCKNQARLLKPSIRSFRKTKLTIPIIVFFAIHFYPSSALTFEISTHQQITIKAIESVEHSLNAYLINNLNLPGGLNSSVAGLTPTEWMIKGSEFEDGSLRPGNHFHDPILNDGLGVFSSAISWSLLPINSQFPEGSYSWNDAREYYFKALTSPTKTERDEYWGKMFRALGQIMHLIQDMASPAHVRNDPHLSYGGNGDTDGLHDFMEARDVATYTGAGIISPDSSLLRETGAVRPEPFSNLFDTNRYTGNNPDATRGGNVGLAEYANANFFSDDRIPGQGNTISRFSPFSRSYDYPSLAELIPAPSPSPYLTLSRLGSSTFPGARIAKYTGNHALAKFSLGHLQYELIGQLQLDDAVYDAYSTHLIPRAVGYSAAVLNYFFRGELEITHNVYLIRGENLGGPYCSDKPAEELGALEVNAVIPPDLDFDGTIHFYYDRSDGTRVHLYEDNYDPSFGGEIWQGDSLPPAEISNPVRWVIVLKGQAGPGNHEPQTIIGKTGLADWHIQCVH